MNQKPKQQKTPKKSKSWYFEKINKIEKSLPRITKKKGESDQIN